MSVLKRKRKGNRVHRREGRDRMSDGKCVNTDRALNGWALTGDMYWRCVFTGSVCVYLCPFVPSGLSYRIIESVFVFYRFHRSGEYGRLRVAVFMGSCFASHKSPPMSKTHHCKSLWCCKNSLIRVCQESVSGQIWGLCHTQTSKHDSSHLPWFNWHGHRNNQ